MSGPGRTVSALVTNVQRFSVHDGPGIRTTVFFKGCTLRCAWCHNPETISRAAELSVDADRCLSCRACADACAPGAIETRAPDGIDRDRCDACGECVEACPSGAISSIGRRMTAAELVDELLADRAFFESSGGGVTLSGGEPVLQSTLLMELAPALRAEGIHVLLQTAGHYPFARLEPLLPHLDVLHFDFKLGDPARFAALTHGRLDVVEDTLRRTLRAHADVRVRVPLLPGQNTGPSDVAAIGARLRNLGVERVELLPYNGLWESKLSRLETAQKPLGWSGTVDVERIRRDLAEDGVLATHPVVHP